MVLTPRRRGQLRLGVALAVCALLVAGLSWAAADVEADNQRDTTRQIVEGL